MTHALRTYRQNTNVTLDRLARNVGVSKSFLSKIEAYKARPSLSVVDRIVAYTNGVVTANDFLSASPDADSAPAGTLGKPTPAGEKRERVA